MDDQVGITAATANQHEVLAERQKSIPGRISFSIDNKSTSEIGPVKEVAPSKKDCWSVIINQGLIN